MLKRKESVIITIQINPNLHSILRETKTTKQTWFEFLCKPVLKQIQEEREAERRMLLTRQQIEDEDARNEAIDKEE